MEDYLEKYFHRKIHDNIGYQIVEDQSGFISARFCTDNLFILQQLIAKSIALGSEVHLAFVDLEKAYDTVPRLKLCNALQQLGINRPF